MKMMATGLILFLMSLPAVSAPVLHRAFEPAAASLDINQESQSLSVFFSLSADAFKHVSQGTPIALVVDRLNDYPELVVPAQSALCKSTRQQFLHEPEKNQATHARRVSGYLHFKCQKPEKLKQIKIQFSRALPGLKEVSVWLITDFWQSKQTLSRKDDTIQIKNDPGFLGRSP